MFSGKLLFSVFNTALKSYSSKVVNIGNSKTFVYNVINSKYFSTEVNVVTFEDIKKIKPEENVVLIDVREPLELKETGVIPGSINIPLGEVEVAFTQTTDQVFLKKYGKPKPAPSDPIIFSCKAGIRSAKAQTIVQNMGYLNVKNYLGGWIDWDTNKK
ncbi:unnamed protein product [Brassicogethes aeneus]|uniref:Rhodanese domain-containing protein n=1 Tax=Brassicogethes aeneus TaxID=1431903 RepID=A0A9P0AZI5_BRAAE|nr:unnamed protein product [Brassicogethes aeneus]